MMAFVYSGSMCIPLFVTMNPKNFLEDTPIKEFKGFIQSLYFHNLSNTCVSVVENPLAFCF